VTELTLLAQQSAGLRVPMHILPLLLFATLAFAGSPSHTVTSFSNLPARLFFFDDSESAIYYDGTERKVHVSQDSGKSWNKADGILESDEIIGVIEHPFAHSLAFALTRGQKHYRTTDRGKSWRSFEVPLPPALVARPLSFHSDSTKSGYILYQGTRCEKSPFGWGSVCHDETYYTKEAFGEIGGIENQRLITDSSLCQFAHSSNEFLHNAHDDLIYCVAFDQSSNNPTGSHTIASSKLFSSTDFFKSRKVEDLGIGKNAKGVVALAVVSKFALVALRDLSPGNEGQMILYVTIDTVNWARAEFPQSSSARLRENAYTILESTTHSLAVDVVLGYNQDRAEIGTLFVSNSNGTYFVQSLKDTNRNEWGFVDYERMYGMEGIGLANIVSNAADVEGHGAAKRLVTQITFNDGRSWAPLNVSDKGRKPECDPKGDACNLHLHSVTDAHNFGRIFSSPAPGYAMGVGNVGAHLKRT
jgi:hypothetical protein